MTERVAIAVRLYLESQERIRAAPGTGVWTETWARLHPLLAEMDPSEASLFFDVIGAISCTG